MREFQRQFDGNGHVPIHIPGFIESDELAGPFNPGTVLDFDRSNGDAMRIKLFDLRRAT